MFIWYKEQSSVKYGRTHFIKFFFQLNSYNDKKLILSTYKRIKILKTMHKNFRSIRIFEITNSVFYCIFTFILLF